MSEAKYTPGEWTLHLSEHDLPVIEVAPHRTIVVEARSYDEAVANANLFFHSRELLETLEAMLKQYGSTDRLSEQARQAINRVRGKQP